VLTAHHRRDQAETLLLRLVRGTGPRGLRAMEARSELGEGVGLLRPLLETPREEIHRLALERGLSWCEDSSNHSEDFLRNRIRHRLLPLFEELRPGAERRLARLAGQLRDEGQALDALLQERLEKDLHHGPGWAVVPRSLLLEGPAVARRAVMQAVRRLEVAETEVLPESVRALLRAIRETQARQRCFELGAGLVAWLVTEAVCVLRVSTWPPRRSWLEEGLPADDPEIRHLLDVEVLGPTGAGIEQGLRIRTRRPGDRLGHRRTSLKELFIEKRLAGFLRGRWPLLEDAEGLAVVPGLWQRPGASGLRLRFGATWPRPLLPTGI
jgi:tRNA(Ile)-lysidine synthase